MTADPAADVTTVRVAVISDIHAFHGPASGEPPSHADAAAPEDQPTQHPFAGLRSLITTEALRADILLCCGDLADKADPASVKYAWAFLRDAAQLLGGQLCATAGNHDVDSRYTYNDFDARGVLQTLVPTFPVSDAALADQFWARHFCVIESGELRLVLLNSAAYHGQGPPRAEAPEYSRGRIAASTVERLKDALRNSAAARINILACHHHPMAMPNVDDDGSHMQNGESLIQLLADDRSNWMIIHGHKHVPRLLHAQGGNNAPILLGAGSFSAVLTGRWATTTPNQFYVLEFPAGTAGDVGLPLAGRFKAWDWHIGLGWQPAKDQSGLPHLGGFGSREHALTVAQKIVALLDETPGVPIQWEEVLVRYPEYEFLSPDDMDRVKRELREGLAVRVQDGAGYPIELAK
jgi:predicted phosphodiesterase